MLVISNNLIGKMTIPKEAIIRINLAWIDTRKEAEKILDKSKHLIYLDFPSGRTKPPQPKISLQEAINLSNHSKVKYFAISNSENAEDLKDLMKKTQAEIVPKIETALGIKNMSKMAKVGIKHYMLDKEDLYVNVNCDSKKYQELVKEARRHLGVMELQGVVFI